MKLHVLFVAAALSGCATTNSNMVTVWYPTNDSDEGWAARDRVMAICRSQAYSSAAPTGAYHVPAQQGSVTVNNQYAPKQPTYGGNNPYYVQPGNNHGQALSNLGNSIASARAAKEAQQARDEAIQYAFEGCMYSNGFEKFVTTKDKWQEAIRHTSQKGAASP